MELTTELPELNDLEQVNGPKPEPPVQPTSGFKCPSCGRSYDTERGLKMHRSMSHKRGRPTGKRKAAQPATDVQIAENLIAALRLDGRLTAAQVRRLAPWLEEGLLIRNLSKP